MSALQDDSTNYLGLEIRRPVVEFALMRKSKRQCTNVHFVSSNANVDLQNILTSLAAHNVAVKMVCVQFPDPHFKKRHKKRRVVNDDLVAIIASGCPLGTLVFVQSDVREVIDDAVEHFGRSPCFATVEGFDLENLSGNLSPVALQTEREHATISKGMPVYRMLYQLVDNSGNSKDNAAVMPKDQQGEIHDAGQETDSCTITSGPQ